MSLKYLFITLFSGIATIVTAQQQVGINTLTPDRMLEVEGSESQHIRLHANVPYATEVGLELLRGNEDSNARDWKVTNDGGVLKFMTGTDNFITEGSEAMRIASGIHIGIGTTSPVAKLHVDGGEDVSNTQDGFLLLGQKSSANLIFGPSEILARNNGNSASLFIQGEGGNTSIAQQGSGNVYFAPDGGRLHVGSAFGSSRMNIDTDGFHLSLRNETNDWYIGASNSSWISGAEQLIFSPTSGSDDGILRLMDVGENDGVNAPVRFAYNDEALLLDGNEIDAVSGPLYINSNSDHDSYLNPSGGKVGIGTTNPHGLLHINSEAFALGLEQDGYIWYISPYSGGNLHFYHDGIVMSYIELYTGNWVALSDARLKTNIRPIRPVMASLRNLPLYAYRMIDDTTGHTDIGLLAQDLEQSFPELVSTSEKGEYGVAYDQLSVVAIKGIQEQQEQLMHIAAQLDALESKN